MIHSVYTPQLTNSIWQNQQLKHIRTQPTDSGKISRCYTLGL
jgi:hypothetical protein